MQKAKANGIQDYDNCFKQPASEYDDYKSDAATIATAIKDMCDSELTEASIQLSSPTAPLGQVRGELERTEGMWALRAVLKMRRLEVQAHKPHPTSP